MNLPSPMRRLRPSAILAAVLAVVIAACDDPAPPSPSGPATTGPAPAPPSSAAPAPGPADPVAPPGAADPTASAVPAASAEPAGPGTDAGADAGADAGNRPTRDAGAPDDAGVTPPASTGAQASADAGTDAAASAGLPAPAPGSADAVAAEVDAVFKDVGLYTARFKQEHTQKIANVVRKQSGKVTIQRPNRMSFRYDPPVKNRIVSDGTTLKIYVADDEQMFVTPVQNSEYPGALAFFMGNGLRPSFTFTFNEKANFEGGPVLVGKPRAPTPHYEYVMFYVDKALLAKKDPGTIRRVLIVDAQGNRNRFDFEDVKVPQSVDPAEFQFTPPAGTAIKQN